MKERPIIFSAPMVRAILDGRKTQTRDVVKPQPVGVNNYEPGFVNEAWNSGFIDVDCPYGKPGDRLSVLLEYPRVTLKITDVRVQRLQEISEEDALAEGVELRDEKECMRKWGVAHDPRMAFADLWESTHGAGSWDANPWVWALVFKRLEGYQL